MSGTNLNELPTSNTNGTRAPSDSTTAFPREARGAGVTISEMMVTELTMVVIIIVHYVGTTMNFIWREGKFKLEYGSNYRMGLEPVGTSLAKI